MTSTHACQELRQRVHVKSAATTAYLEIGHTEGEAWENSHHCQHEPSCTDVG